MKKQWIILAMVVLLSFSCKKENKNYSPVQTKLKVAVNGKEIDDPKLMAFYPSSLIVNSPKRFFQLDFTYADTGYVSLFFPLVSGREFTAQMLVEFGTGSHFESQDCLLSLQVNEGIEYIALSGTFTYEGHNPYNLTEKLEVTGTFENLLYEKP